MADDDPENIDFRELKLDLENPRAPGEAFADEPAALEFLLDHADLDELVQSILSAGWLDYEPPIVLETAKTVLEGNRRLAALRLIDDAQLRKKLKYELPEIKSPKALPQKI